MDDDKETRKIEPMYLINKDNQYSNMINSFSDHSGKEFVPGQV